MTTSPITLTPISGSAIRLASARLFHFLRGAWVADCILDLGQNQTIPSGKVTLNFGGVSFQGTIDPKSSGPFGPSAQARVVGGGGNWDKTVTPQDFFNSSGVPSSNLYQQTAVLIGETMAPGDVPPNPTQNGDSFVRFGTGPACQIFKDLNWWVDTQGLTHSAPRPNQNPDSSFVIKSWEPVKQLLTFACDTVLYPNTTIVDSRLSGGNLVVTVIEQIFDSQGSHGFAWGNTSSNPSNNLADNLKNAVLFWGRLNLRSFHRYRLVLYQGEGQAALQAVTKILGVPDIIPLTQWSGLSGLSAVLAPGQEVMIGFENADPGLPFVVSYSPNGLPQRATLDASMLVEVGPSAALVQLAGGSTPLVPTPWASAIAAALETLGTALAAFGTGPTTPLTPLGPLGTALVSSLTAAPSPATEKVQGQ